MLSEMPAFAAMPEPHRLEFFDMLLVTSGNGRFDLDGEGHEVHAGQLFLTLPAQIRRWDVTGLDGACVFFTGEFIEHLFADARFLAQFACLNSRRVTGALTLTANEQRQFLQTFQAMRRELNTLQSDATDLLRARLYELLVLVNRWYRERHGDIGSRGHATVDQFMAMIERDFREHHQVQDYASRLRVSPGHLSLLCKTHLGRSAGNTIQHRLMIEAARLLRYTDKPAFVIARELGFADASYFGRFIRRNTGATPRQYRNGG